MKVLHLIQPCPRDECEERKRRSECEKNKLKSKAKRKSCDDREDAPESFDAGETRSLMTPYRALSSDVSNPSAI